MKPDIDEILSDDYLDDIIGVKANDYGRKPMNRLKNEPVALGVAIRLVLVAAMSFGLHLTDAQLVATMAAVEAVIGLFTRQSVTPNQLAEARVDQGLRPTQPRS